MVEQVVTHPYGQELNAETYAICKADLLLKGGGRGSGQHRRRCRIFHPCERCLSRRGSSTLCCRIRLTGRAGKATLSGWAGKVQFRIRASWSTMTVTRSTHWSPGRKDGQMMFLANLLSKMKTDTLLGSRIAEVHNGSSLFTGDAGQGESNIRRWIIENDWLEAIVALPLNMFYNTDIATYIWVLSNRKAERDPRRAGQVQLIDATSWHVPLRRNQGKKNCMLSGDDIARIEAALLDFEESGLLEDPARRGLWILENHRRSSPPPRWRRSWPRLHQGEARRAPRRWSRGLA